MFFFLFLCYRLHSKSALLYSSNAWRIKGWSNSCLPHTSSQKNIYGCFQQLFITETAKFHCSMIKISGFTGVFMNFDVCLCWWWMKHSINDHTTQHNKSSRGFLLYSDHQTHIEHFRSHWREHDYIKTTPICVTSVRAQTTWRGRWHVSAVLRKCQNAMFLRKYFDVEKFYWPAVDGSVFIC